jgi:hypothetical protein
VNARFIVSVVIIVFVVVTGSTEYR